MCTYKIFHPVETCKISFVTFEFIHLTDHSSLHLSDFVHRSLSSPLISLNCLLTSLLFTYLLSPVSLRLFLRLSHPCLGICILSVYLFFQISSLKSFRSYSVMLNLCPYLSFSNCCPSTHSFYFNHSISASVVSPSVIFLVSFLDLSYGCFSLFLCSMQLVLFGKSSGVRWCRVWRTKAATC